MENKINHNLDSIEELIKTYGGKHNLVFKVNSDYGEFLKDDILLIVDRSEQRKYNPNYKIYLTSTSLYSDSFYVSDFCQLINKNIFTPYYRFDLVK